MREFHSILISQICIIWWFVLERLCSLECSFPRASPCLLNIRSVTFPSRFSIFPRSSKSQTLRSVVQCIADSHYLNSNSCANRCIPFLCISVLWCAEGYSLSLSLPYRANPLRQLHLFSSVSVLFTNLNFSFDATRFALQKQQIYYICYLQATLVQLIFMIHIR